MIVYYAHCTALYDTPQEARDIALLESLRWRVINPNKPEIEVMVQTIKATPGTDYMLMFRSMIEECDIVVFRATPGGAITAGVAKELGYAREFNLPILELPSAILRRRLSVAATKEYISEVGKR